MEEYNEFLFVLLFYQIEPLIYILNDMQRIYYIIFCDISPQNILTSMLEKQLSIISPY